MKKIEFSEKSHTYNKGDVIYTSVTRLISRYKEKFDSAFWLRYKALEELIPDTFNTVKSLYTPPYPDTFLIEVTDIYLNELNLSRSTLTNKENEIKKSWADINLKSTVKGHKYHELKEIDSYSNKLELNPFTNKKVPVIQKTVDLGSQNQSLLKNLYKLEDGYYPELLIWNDPYKLAGQADRVFIETVENLRFVDIDDYKTNKKIRKDNNFQTMKFPIEHLDDCVSGDTKLITQTGITTIEESVGKEIKIWNGSKWSKVTPFLTKRNTDIFRVTFDDGSYLDCTANHKFLIKYRLDKDFEEQTTLSIIRKMNDTKYLPRIPNSNINKDSGFVNHKCMYDYGFVLGDGTIEVNGIIKAQLGTNDKNLNFNTADIREYRNNTSIAYFNLDYDLAYSIKYKKGLPNELFNLTKKSTLDFLAGWIDADGSNTNNNKSLRLYGKEDKLRDAQLLFTKCGIKSSLKLMQEKGRVTNLGIRVNDVWYLSVTKTFEIPCQRVICENKDESSKKHKWQIIKEIKKLNKQDSYCLTEKEKGTCVFNNVLTKQCNYNHYRLQGSLYAWMLQEFGFIIRNLSFTHTPDPEDEDNSTFYDYDFLFEEVEDILEYEKNFKE